MRLTSAQLEILRFAREKDDWIQPGDVSRDTSTKWQPEAIPVERKLILQLVSKGLMMKSGDQLREKYSITPEGTDELAKRDK